MRDGLSCYVKCQMKPPKYGMLIHVDAVLLCFVCVCLSACANKNGWLCIHEHCRCCPNSRRCLVYIHTSPSSPVTTCYVLTTDVTTSPMPMIVPSPYSPSSPVTTCYVLTTDVTTSPMPMTVPSPCSPSSPVTTCYVLTTDVTTSPMPMTVPSPWSHFTT